MASTATTGAAPHQPGVVLPAAQERTGAAGHTPRQGDDTGDGGEEPEQHRPSTDGWPSGRRPGGVGTVTRSDDGPRAGTVLSPDPVAAVDVGREVTLQHNGEVGPEESGLLPRVDTGTRVPLLSMVKLISPWLISWTERSTTTPSYAEAAVPSWARGHDGSSAVLKVHGGAPEALHHQEHKGPDHHGPATPQPAGRPLSRARTRAAGPTAPGRYAARLRVRLGARLCSCFHGQGVGPASPGACRAPAAGPAGRPNRRRRPGSTARRG